MNKQQAHEILNRCRDGQPMSLLVTNQALYATGDISGLFGEPLRFDGDEQRVDRPRQTHDQTAEVGFSYSKYLDYSETKGVTQ
jgi:hypothetical protein